MFAHSAPTRIFCHISPYTQKVLHIVLAKLPPSALTLPRKREEASALSDRKRMAFEKEGKHVQNEGEIKAFHKVLCHHFCTVSKDKPLRKNIVDILGLYIVVP